MSLSDIIKMNRYQVEYPNYNNFDDYEDDYNDEIKLHKYNKYDSNDKLKSNIINSIIVLFIIFLFSSTFYTKIDELTVNSGIRLFTKEGEPNILLIGLQFLILFGLMKLVCKY